MKTPAGRECPYFYGDYRRGRQHEECRLLDADPDAGQWRAVLCHSCPVPAIAMANACPHLRLRGRVGSRWLGFVQQVEVTAYCHKTDAEVREPEVGCGHCHELPVPGL
jgi:hypothetical protein